jgi:hypothetical protein
VGVDEGRVDRVVEGIVDASLRSFTTTFTGDYDATSFIFSSASTDVHDAASFVSLAFTYVHDAASSVSLAFTYVYDAVLANGDGGYVTGHDGGHNSIDSWHLEGEN